MKVTFGAYEGEWVLGGFTKGGAREIAIEGAEKIQHNGDIDSLKAHFTESEYL
ncbi:hypothetical protein [Vibrio hepatarius]|uniref:hypothetical protein n=1 Tax=Vibrio hepatarius TaxID=171383 RepID=UPI001C09901B|nr:hypothetical protein [Vibrio hepatarius]MBU2897646.1 hypothetical protein [Vibrio hepatarius]